MGSLLSSVTSFFGGSGGFAVVAGLVLCVLAAFGLAECRQSKIDDLTAANHELRLAAESNARAVDELQRDRNISDKITAEQEAERDEIKRNTEADRAEVAAPVDWRNELLPADVLRVFGNPDCSAGGNGAIDPASGVDASGDRTRLAWTE